jgi:hypothetical protein
MARRHLETGGVVTPMYGRKGSPGFVGRPTLTQQRWPRRSRRNCAPAVMPGQAGTAACRTSWKRPDGQVLVPRAVLERMGAGDTARSEQLLGCLVSEMQSRRAPGASRERQR